MKIFADTARIEELRELLARGVIEGVTTNPTLLRQAANGGILHHLAEISGMLRDVGSLPLSIQVMTTDAESMRRQAELLHERLNYPGLAIKIPIGWNELEVVNQLAADGLAVNCTACMTETQVLLAAAAGARYASLFYGKMSDAGMDSGRVVTESARLLASSHPKCELIVGSIRTPAVITDVLRAGAPIVTVPFSHFSSIAAHEKTAEAVSRFASDFQAFE